MELTKNIFFIFVKLVENSTVKISYTGRFFQDDSKDVYIHFGFGNAWENLQEIKMEKTELGFQAEIELIGTDTFNFCLRNDKNEWDNNDGQNYIFPIESVPVSEDESQELSLIVSSPRRLRKAYIWSKKIKLAIYKIITFFPKLLSGNYKRKIKE